MPGGDKENKVMFLIVLTLVLVWTLASLLYFVQR